jgi:hypothetical protein
MNAHEVTLLLRDQILCKRYRCDICSELYCQPPSTREARMSAMEVSMANGKSARISLNPQHQNIEVINKLVANILGRAGCGTCGRIAYLAVQFVGDPGPDLAKEGVISVQTEGF